MGLFDETPKQEVKQETQIPATDWSKLETKKEESKMEEVVNERVTRMAEALKDAKKAYDLAGVAFNSEDLRAIAITFTIDEGKNVRMQSFSKAPGTLGRSEPKPLAETPIQSDWIKIEEFNTPYTMKLVGIVGTRIDNYGKEQTIFELEGGSKYSTSGKIVSALKKAVGQTVVVSKSRNDKFINYSVKDSKGQELV